MEPAVEGDRQAEPTAPAPPSSRRHRGRLNRDRVVAAALDQIDERGLAGLSMRTLGARLEVEAMTLYRYTPSKADLLDAVADLLLTQMRTAPPPHLRQHPPSQRLPERGQDWQGRLRDIAYAVRGTALAHPSAFGLLASYTPPQAWMRPPLCEPTWAASILSGLRSVGLDEATALGAYHDLAGFLLGHLLPETAREAATATREATAVGVGSSAPDPKIIQRTQQSALRAYATGEFDESLDRLVDHLARSLRPR